MPDTEARWQDGKSAIPQARPTQNIELEWADGKSGYSGLEQYTGGPQFKPWFARNSNVLIPVPIVGGARNA